PSSGPIVSAVSGCYRLTNSSTSRCGTRFLNASTATVLTMTGTGFFDPLSILVAGAVCTPVVMADSSSTTRTCSLPVNGEAGLDKPVVVVSAQYTSAPVSAVSFAAPKL